MKYSIMHDLESDDYWVVNRSTERATEIKVYESDSLHDCFGWAFANGKRLNSELQDEVVWCVYWSDFDENYYICPDKGDGTLDDVCFIGTEEECNDWYDKHYISESNYDNEDLGNEIL